MPLLLNSLQQRLEFFDDLRILLRDVLFLAGVGGEVVKLDGLSVVGGVVAA